MSILNVDKIQPIGGGSTITVDATNIGIASSITHIGDTDTAIRFPSNDTVSVETSGKERLYIKSDGKIGINTTTPNSTLEVQGDSGTNDAQITFTRHGTPINDGVIGLNYYRIGTDSVAGMGAFRESAIDDAYLAFFTQPTGGNYTERVRIDSSGRMGIGDNSPDRELVVKNASSNAGVKIEASNSHTSQLFFSDTDAENVARISVFHGSGQATSNALIFDTAGTTRMMISSGGDVTIGNSSVAFPSGGGLQVYNASAPRIKLTNSTTGVASGDGLQIYVSGSSAIFDQKENAEMRFYTNATERLRIASDGDLTHTGADNVEYKMKCGTSTGNNILAFLNSSGTTRGNITYDSDHNFLLFNVNQGERARIDSSGRLLLGTTTEGHANGDDLTIATSGDTGITLRSGTSGAGNIYFSDATSGDGEYKGFISYGHNVDGLYFATNTSTRMFINSAGRVGINETSPNATLHIKNADGANNRLELVHANDAASEQNQITFKNASTQYAYIVSGKDGSNNSIGLTFGTGTTERVRIASGGNLVIGDSGSITPGSLLHLYQASNDPYITIQRGSGDSAVAIGGIMWKNNTNTTAGIYGFTDNVNDGTLRFHTAEGGSNTEKLHITKAGAVVIQREHLQIGRNGSNTSGFSKGGIVFSTPAYNEYHYTWSGQSSYTIDITCGSYFHCEFIYTQAQTNGGTRMHYYVRGKFANNHTTHTGIMWEWHGDDGGLDVQFNVSDQSGNGNINMRSNLNHGGNTNAGQGYVNGGGEGQNTGSANGRLRISETYSWGSVSTRCLIIKQYYGSHSASIS